MVPAQIVVADAVIDTDGVTEEVTIMMIALLVAVDVVVHGALLVNTTVTTSLLFKVVEEKVGLLVPAFTPFTFH